MTGAASAERKVPHKVQVLLATLLARGNRVVSTEQIIAEIWGESPPRQATAAVHVYISQLRKLLTVPRGAEHPVVTRAPGYMINLQGEETDLDVFRARLGQGRACQARGDHLAAAGHFESALSLWRGPVLGDLRGGLILDGFALWLEKLRLECTELLADSNLLMGCHRTVVSFLYEALSEHALHETFYHQLMIALYRSNRRAEALEVYQRARRTLQAELGLEPCRALRDIHQAILSSDDRLEAAVPIAL
ncbi:AfsR/SARP family transcriptional regulator [Streptantibioticus cattleyicolor]|nr:AfsR/SARP family transcriptional regulator [Streptantibioticus cattleyicolor]